MCFSRLTQDVQLKKSGNIKNKPNRTSENK